MENTASIETHILTELKSEISKITKDPDFESRVRSKSRDAIMKELEVYRKEVWAILPKYIWGPLLFVLTPMEVALFINTICAYFLHRDLNKELSEHTERENNAGYLPLATEISAPIKKAFDAAIQNSEQEPNLVFNLHSKIGEIGIDPVVLHHVYRQMPEIQARVTEAIAQQSGISQLIA